jgi:hypothetical protein
MGSVCSSDAHRSRGSSNSSNEGRPRHRRDEINDVLATYITVTTLRHIVIGYTTSPLIVMVHGTRLRYLVPFGHHTTTTTNTSTMEQRGGWHSGPLLPISIKASAHWASVFNGILTLNSTAYQASTNNRPRCVTYDITLDDMLKHSIDDNAPVAASSEESLWCRRYWSASYLLNRTRMSSSCVTTLSKGNIHLIGGNWENGNNSIPIGVCHTMYDRDHDKWRCMPPIPDYVPNQFGMATAYDPSSDRIWAIGGGGTMRSMKLFAQYDIKSNKWRSLLPLYNPRRSPIAFYVADRFAKSLSITRGGKGEGGHGSGSIYVGGGVGSNGRIIIEFERYSIDDEKWYMSACLLPEALVGQSHIIYEQQSSNDGPILALIGGASLSSGRADPVNENVFIDEQLVDSTYSSSVWYIALNQLEHNTWTRGPSLPHGVTGAAVVLTEHS